MSKKEIFIAHGRDKLPALELARLIEKRYQINTVFLEEKAHKGRTIMEKFEDYSQVDFAVIILTPDDFGALKGEKPEERARQNVIFELGQLTGRMGREKVCIFIKGDIDIPSDLSGVGYYRFYESIKECFLDFENELKEAGLITIPSDIVKLRKEEIKQEPRDLYLDFGLARGTTRIPWNDFEAVEIQGIIYQYFISLGYSVDWVSKVSRIRAKKIGCDLFCMKDEKTIGITVCKTPRLKDYEQIKRLANKDYQKKLFLFVSPPSLSLTEQIADLSEKVKMVSINEFVQEMQDSEVGSQILCYLYYSNSKFVKLAGNFLSELVDLTIRSPDENSYKKSAKPLPELWQLKDHSVAMEKSLEMLLNILEEPTFYAGSSTTNLLNIFKQALWTLTYEMNAFYRIWTKLLKKYRNLVHQTHNKYGDRSNWLGLWNFGHYMIKSGLYSPRILREDLKNLSDLSKDLYEKEEEKYAKLVRKETGRIYVPTPFFANFVREDFLRPHFGFALSLESLVDQMFEL